MSIEIIQSVLQAEEQAEAIKKRSEAEARDIIAAAHRQARELEQNMLETAEAEAKKIIDSAKSSAADAVTKLNNEVLAECDAIKAKAHERINQAIELIIRKVVNLDGSR